MIAFLLERLLQEQKELLYMFVCVHQSIFCRSFWVFIWWASLWCWEIRNSRFSCVCLVSCYVSSGVYAQVGCLLCVGLHILPKMTRVYQSPYWRCSAVDISEQGVTNSLLWKYLQEECGHSKHDVIMVCFEVVWGVLWSGPRCVHMKHLWPFESWFVGNDSWLWFNRIDVTIWQWLSKHLPFKQEVQLIHPSILQQRPVLPACENSISVGSIAVCIGLSDWETSFSCQSIHSAHLCMYIPHVLSLGGMFQLVIASA